MLFGIDVYSTEYLVAVETDEKGHKDRNLIFEEKSQKALEKKLGCEFITINTSRAGYDADSEVSGIQTFISKFNEKKKKGTRRRNNKIKTSINKSKCISCQKCLTTLQKMKNTQWKIKPIKIEKDMEQRIVLGVKILPIILGDETYKWQMNYSEKNQTGLFVDLIRQDF